MTCWCHQEGLGREPCFHGLGWEEVPGVALGLSGEMAQLCDYLVEENSRQRNSKDAGWGRGWGGGGREWGGEGDVGSI